MTPLVCTDQVVADFTSVLEAGQDVVVVSLDCPSRGIPLVELLRAAHWQGPILVLCTQSTLPSLRELEKYDVQSILTLQATLRQFETAIYRVVDGKSEPLRPQYLRVMRLLLPEPVDPPLTLREIEVLRLLADGISNEKIAGELQLSIRTVENHMRGINDKLGVHTRTAAVVTAMGKGIIDLTRL